MKHPTTNIIIYTKLKRKKTKVLTNVRNKLAAYQSQVADFHILVGRAQKYLLARGCLPQHMQELARNHSPVVQRPMPVPRGWLIIMLFIVVNGFKTF